MHEIVLKFIKSFIASNGYPPTIREIKDGCDISSTSVVASKLNILEERGEIKRTPFISRGIVVNE